MSLAPCPKPEATAFLKSLGVAPSYLNPEFDRCYCRHCYEGPKTIDNEGPTPYVVPGGGWVRFGLHPVGGEQRAQALDIFNKWSACFHGVKSADFLKSIFENGGLMKPGDYQSSEEGPKLKKARSGNSDGREDKVVYTSPTIKYAGLKYYAEPVTFTTAAGAEMRGSIVLQCRQKPGSFKKQAETMGFERDMPGHLKAHCPSALHAGHSTGNAPRGFAPLGLLYGGRSTQAASQEGGRRSF